MGDQSGIVWIIHDPTRVATATSSILKVTIIFIYIKLIMHHEKMKVSARRRLVLYTQKFNPSTGRREF